MDIGSDKDARMGCLVACSTAGGTPFSTVMAALPTFDLGRRWCLCFPAFLLQHACNGNGCPPRHACHMQGAMDGVTASNTLWLHKAANWTGMLVEADPVRAACSEGDTPFQSARGACAAWPAGGPQARTLGACCSDALLPAPACPAKLAVAHTECWPRLVRCAAVPIPMPNPAEPGSRAV